MIYRFFGDTHAAQLDFRSAYDVEYDFAYHVGDFGFGFKGINRNTKIEGIDGFIRGNHDNPVEGRAHPLYLGDYGYKNGLFFTSGAWSIDRAMRREGRDWWPEEELNMEELTNAVALYEATRPDIVMTHDAPFGIVEKMKLPRMFLRAITPTRTTLALMTMLEIHQPKVWVFGHWHYTREYQEGNTKFVCVGVDEHVDITI